MKSIVTILAMLACGLCHAADTPRLAFPGKVVSITDGDTVTVDITIRINVRLLKCWAPEVRGIEKPAGLKAKEKLQSLALGKSGTVTVPLGDNLEDSLSFGRVLAFITIEGKDLSHEMVASGLATEHREPD